MKPSKAAMTIGPNTLVLPWSIVEAAKKGTLKVIDPDGRVVSDLVVTGMPTDLVMSFLTSGGTLELMTVHESLMRTWVYPAERQAWEDAWRVWAERDLQSVIAAREHTLKAHAQDEKQRLLEAIGPTRSDVRRRRL